MARPTYRCPFCGNDMTMAHRVIVDPKKSNGMSQPKAVTLCYDCGEPVYIDRGREELGFRKPTEAEYVFLVDSKEYHNSRETWAQVKREGTQTPATDAWEAYSEYLDATLQMPKSVAPAASLIFYSGMSAALRYLSTVTDREMFNLRINILNTELGALREGLLEEADAYARYKSDGKKPRKGR